jgi:rare lipoprotein A (peptidoglycan hydrolase)
MNLGGMKLRHGFSIERMRASFSALALAALCLSACVGSSPDTNSAPLASPLLPVEKERLPRFAQTGLASWYMRTAKLTRTANGEQLGANKLTAAHRSLPMDTIVRVTNLKNGLSVEVRINDRGPFVGGRVIDLSHDAATLIGMKDTGVVPVRLEVFDVDQGGKVANRTAAK